MRARLAGGSSPLGSSDDGLLWQEGGRPPGEPAHKQFCDTSSPWLVPVLWDQNCTRALPRRSHVASLVAKPSVEGGLVWKETKNQLGHGGNGNELRDSRLGLPSSPRPALAAFSYTRGSG